MEKFIDDYTPVEVELIDEEGNSKILRSQKITIKKLRKLKEIDKKLSGDAVVDRLDVIFEQIIMFFGGTIDDYDGFTIKQITDAIAYIGKYIRDPR